MRRRNNKTPFQTFQFLQIKFFLAKSTVSKNKKRRYTAQNSVGQVFDEYCIEDQDSEKKVYTIEDNHEKEKFCYNHLKGDECLPYSKKHLPKNKAASNTKFHPARLTADGVLLLFSQHIRLVAQHPSALQGFMNDQQYS